MTTLCICPKIWTNDSPPRLERYALAFNCEVHANSRADPVAMIIELQKDIELLKAANARLRAGQTTTPGVKPGEGEGK